MSALTSEALRAQDEQYSLEIRQAKESDLLSCTSGRSALSALSAASNSSKRSRPRRLPVTCNVRILTCDVAASAVPPQRSQQQRRFRITLSHRNRKVADAPSVARQEKSARGLTYRCAWSSDKACGTVATAVNRHGQLRPPLVFILELSEESSPGKGPSAFTPESLARHSIVLEEFHPGTRRGRVALGTTASVVIEVSFEILELPPPDPAEESIPTTQETYQPPPRAYPEAKRRSTKSGCPCSFQEGETRTRRRRGRVAFRTPGEDVPDRTPAGPCSRRTDITDGRTPTDPCTKGHPDCSVQCIVA
eukprot:Hpha_TRINITY_DN14_c0_g1::TRINITY_DN14_c0_g1_i1::g.110181::m.110181